MAVKKNNFADLVRIEQLRKIESKKAEDLSYASVSDMDGQATTDFKYPDFIQRLTLRTKRLVHDNQLEALLFKPQKQFKHASRICFVVAAILGVLLAGNALGESATLNIYWLLAVLLGFNLLSILLWIAGISFNLHRLSTGVAAQLVGWWASRKKKEDTIASLAQLAWWESCLTGAVGKWRISVLTHKFWLVYLTAGMVFLILLMLAKQYNFIWGTTLLSESSLPKLTQVLGKPMEYIGLGMPDSQQITASRMGAGKQDAETRGAWARFIIGMLIIYGLLPRFILLGISVLMQKWAQYRFKLDLYLPYYIELRQHLMTRKIKAKVVDADPQTPVKQTDITLPPVSNTIPQNAHAFGIELDDQSVWPDAVNCRLNIVDLKSNEEASRLIKTIDGPLLIGVAAHRIPDRGVQRIVKELIADTNAKPWLILLKRQSAEPVSNAREFAWFRLAEACGIPAEHVITQ